MFLFKVLFIFFIYKHSIDCAIVDPNANTGEPGIIPIGSGTTRTTKPYVKPICSYNGNWLNCSNFHTFDQLNFKNGTYSRQEILIICPIDRIPIDDTLDITGYDLKYGYLKFQNINGFPVIADQSKSIKAKYLWIEESDFKLLHNQSPLNEQCNDDVFSQINIKTNPSLFSAFTMVTLWKGTTIPETICPLVFKDADLSNFATHSPFKLTPFDRMDQLNVSIRTLDLYRNDYILDEEHISPVVFKNLETLRTFEVNIVEISDTFFSSFPNLRYIRIEENSLENFFKLNGMRWMRAINAHVNADFSNQTSLQTFRNDRKTVTFEDYANAYTFPDKDFCYFKDFPHKNLVFFQLDTEVKLECTCTLYWLYKHKKYHSFDYVYNKDLIACFKPAIFDSAIETCNFEQRIKDCDNSNTTAATTSTPIITTTARTSTTVTTTGQILTVSTTTAKTTTSTPIRTTTASLITPNPESNQSKLVKLICNDCDNVRVNVN